MTSTNRKPGIQHPLIWPRNWKCTPRAQRQTAKFSIELNPALEHLISELEKLKATNMVISYNLRQRVEGTFRASYPEPSEPGVAVYFQLGGKPYVLASDRWKRVKDNVRAIGLHIAALRGIDRWGVGSVAQAFSGYQALPQTPMSPPSARPWWMVLQVRPSASFDEIKRAYRTLALKHHPDVNGDSRKMSEINQAWEQAQLELSQRHSDVW